MLNSSPTQISRRLKGLLVLCSISFFAACTTVTYTQQIDSFRQAVNSAAVCLSTYYTSLNDFERKLYLDERAFHPELEVLKIDSDGAPTPLLGGKFNAESIKARTDALALLGLYAQRLSDLAGSDAPSQFSTNVQALGTSFAKLDQTFRGDLLKHDPTAKNYAEPIASLISSIGNLYLVQKREDAVAEAVKNGAPKVREIINLLENDLNLVIGPQQKTGFAQRLSERVTFYNEHRADGARDGFSTLEKRRIALAEIEATARAFEAALALSPAQLLESLRDAHEKLLVYAQSPKDPKTFQDYIAALNGLLQNTQEIATQVTALSKL